MMSENDRNQIDLKDATVLVTGGAGLIGSHIVDELVREGANVKVYDSLIRGRAEHLESAQAAGNVKLIEADIRDRDAVRDAVKGSDYVFHQAAAWLRLCQEDPRLSLDANINGTFNVLEACVDEGVKKVVAASSSSVYGEGLYLPTDEKHPFNNDLFYGASKVAAEQYYRAFYKKYGLKYVGLRYLNVYGPRQPFQAAYMDAIMHFLNRIDQDEPPIVRGDGTATVDLIFVEDVARANILAMKQPVENEFYNVCSGTETTIKDLASILIKLRGKEASLEPLFEPMDAGLVSRRWGCPKKAAVELGFVASTSVEDGMRKVIEWRGRIKDAGLLAK